MSNKKSKKSAGYVNSKHVFGNNELIRNGDSLYYLKWQWNKNKKLKDIIFITPKVYSEIKNLLLEVEHDDVYTIVDTGGINKASTKIYRTTPSNLEEIERYLIANKIIKEGTNEN